MPSEDEYRGFGSDAGADAPINAVAEFSTGAGTEKRNQKKKKKKEKAGKSQGDSSVVELQEELSTTKVELHATKTELYQTKNELEATKRNSSKRITTLEKENAALTNKLEKLIASSKGEKHKSESKSGPTAEPPPADAEIQLSIAEAAKGCIGPLVTAKAQAEVRAAGCRKSLEAFNGPKMFKGKLQKAGTDADKAAADAEKAKEAAVADWTKTQLVLAKNSTAAAKRTKHDYDEQLRSVLDSEKQACEKVRGFVQRFNAGAFAKDKARVRVLLPGTNAFREAEVVGGADAGLNDDVEVMLFVESVKINFEYEFGYTERRKVPRQTIYGGVAALRQPLSRTGAAAIDGLVPGLNELYSVASSVHSLFTLFVRGILKNTSKASKKAGAGTVVLSISALKKPKRAAQKIFEKYGGNASGVLDVVRCTFVCDTMEGLLLVLVELSHAAPQWLIVRIKHRLDEHERADASAGYRDVLLNLKHAETGHFVEVQCTLAGFAKIKSAEGGHALYRLLRLLGLDQPAAVVHRGAITSGVLEGIGAGLVQELLAAGTVIGPTELAALPTAAGLAANGCRLTVLDLSSCTGLEGVDAGAALLPPAACKALGAGLVELKLESNKLGGQFKTLAAGIGDHCTGLRVLYLGGNSLEGSLSEGVKALAGLRGLQELELYTNQLTGQIPPEIGQLTALTTLYLSENQLTGQIPTEIGQLTALTVLGLYENQLTGQIPPEIGQLTVLKNLLLYENKLDGEIPSELTKLKSLTQFAASGNKLTNGSKFKESLAKSVAGCKIWV